jgi:hypothetical protein
MATTTTRSGIPDAARWRASHIPDSGPYKVRPGMEDATC